MYLYYIVGIIIGPLTGNLIDQIGNGATIGLGVAVFDLNPNVAKMCQGKTRQGTPDVASHSFGKVLTVREILPETSKNADGVAWRESTGFGRPQVCNVRVNIESLVTHCIAGSSTLPYTMWITPHPYGLNSKPGSLGSDFYLLLF